MNRLVIPSIVATIGEGGGGGSDIHNLGWYTTQAALTTAHPTAEDGDWAIVGSTDTVWVWDSDSNTWVDTDKKGQVTSVNGQTGDVIIPDELPSQTGQNGKSLITNGTNVSWQNVQEVQEQNNDDLIKFWYGTQNEYDALDTYDPNTNYIITDNDQTLSTLLATQQEFDSNAQNKAATPYQVNNALTVKQDTLVSGTNIKTINNTSVLGSGNIQVQPLTNIQTLTTASTELVTNTIYNGGELASVTLTLPATIPADFTVQVEFSSGTTVTTFTAPASLYFNGDACENGVFTPIASKRYCMMIISDGINVQGFVAEK